MVRFVVVVSFVGAIVGIYVVVGRRKNRAREEWRAFGEAHGMDLVSGRMGEASRFTLEGTVLGRSIRVGFDEASYRTTATFQTQLTGEVPVDLEMDQRTVWGRLGRVFGGRQIELGRDPLDEAYVVKGREPDAIRAWLNRDEVADALLELHEFADHVSLERGTLSAQKDGHIDDRDELERGIRCLARCANALERTDAPTSRKW